MSNLSTKSQDLLQFLRKEYVEEGYLYSGSWPYTSLKERGFEKDIIHELLEAGKIQRRNCDDYAFELSAAERGALITDKALCSVWHEKAGEPLLLSIQQEVQNAADISFDKSKGLLSVRTLKSNKDIDRPERMDITCPFSIGQVIVLKYDLPPQVRRTGYADSQCASPGRRFGRFMVTDVIHNLLLCPSKNMLELQSLSEDYNKFYPRQRTMMVFEDLVLKRLRDKPLSLSEQIQSASEHVVEETSPTNPPERDSSMER